MKHGKRRRARELAVHLLYQSEMTNQDATEMFATLESPSGLMCQWYGTMGMEDMSFVRTLVSGVLEHRHQLDQVIGKVSHRWPVQRMMAIDRAIVRMGGYELLFGETPVAVCVNEAVELAKRYGTADSSRFVNGILDAVSKHKRAG